MAGRNTLPIRLPSDPIKAQAMRLWAAERGIVIEELPRYLISRKLVQLDEPYTCRNGHEVMSVYLQQRSRRKHPERHCPVCAQARLKRAGKARTVQAGRPRNGSVFPYVCKHGHAVNGPADEMSSKCKDRVVHWCRECRKKTLRATKQRVRARAKRLREKERDEQCSDTG